MFAIATIGKLFDVTKEIEWKIDNFFSLPEDKDKSYDSPSFLYADESWYLRIYPNGESKHNSTGHIGLYIHRTLSSPPVSLAWTCHLKTCDRKKHGERQCSSGVFDNGHGWGYPKFLERSTLAEKKSELVPSDVLTIICTLQYFSKTPDKDDKIVTAKKCSHCGIPFYEKYVSSHSEKCLEKLIRCPTCQDGVKLRDWIDHECETGRVKATEKLADDLEGILENEEHSDVTITVKDEEFHLHRNILAGRNPFFSSMFKTEMKEKSTGIVSIDDCDPDIFRTFIHFVYTGKVELSLENVCDLYTVADKYREDQLKAECLCFMQSKMSVESVCDFIVLALGHDEKELLKDATEFFCRNTRNIVQSVKWQNFLKKYSTQANELYLKAFDFNVK